MGQFLAAGFFWGEDLYLALGCHNYGHCWLTDKLRWSLGLVFSIHTVDHWGQLGHIAGSTVKATDESLNNIVEVGLVTISYMHRMGSVLL